MKQHITTEQLSELSDSAKLKLGEWWEPDEGDWYTDVPLKANGKPRKNPRLLEKLIYSHDDYGWEDPKVDSRYWISYPLLSIGQMIEFLSKNGWVHIPNMVDMSGVYNAERLCDDLWNAVKRRLYK